MLSLVLFVYLCLTSAIAKEEEPLCLSRYDYDYKVLHKIVSLELELKEIKQLLETQNGQQNKLVEKQREYDEKISTLQKDSVAGLQNKAKTTSYGSGAVYVRWGRTDCPGNGTEKVYTGQAGGSLYSNTGAAANYICLPLDPLWGEYDDSKDNYAPVYGAEYENNFQKLFKGNLANHDVPCAVCRTSRASVVMVPGRNACYGGWTAEYTGYLVAGYIGHKAASEFVCLDDQAETITGSQSSKNGKLFYIAEAACGSLKCPPYVDGRELTCAICSK